MKHWGLLAVGLALAGCTMPGLAVVSADAPVVMVSPTAYPSLGPSPEPSVSPSPSPSVLPSIAPSAAPTVTSRQYVNFDGPGFSLTIPAEWVDKSDDSAMMLTNASGIGLLRMTKEPNKWTLLESAAADRLAAVGSQPVKWTFIDGEPAYEVSNQMADQYRTVSVAYGVIRGGEFYRASIFLASNQDGAQAFALDADAVIASWKWD